MISPTERDDPEDPDGVGHGAGDRFGPFGSGAGVDVDLGGPPARRLLSWRQSQSAAEARTWWGQLWEDVCDLRRRYGLAVRSRWWEDEIQVEALAAFSAWVALYDSGEWEDPPGKLSLLFELERLDPLLRDGHDPFQPDRDRRAFDLHVRGHTG